MAVTGTRRVGTLVPAAATLAAGGIVASMIGVWGALQMRQGDQKIQVTGSARKRIVSDKVVWRATVSYQGDTIGSTYEAVRTAVPKVKAYLIEKGIPEADITVDSVQTTAQTSNSDTDSGRVIGYTLRQSVEVHSTDVNRVGKIAREATELIKEDIAIESGTPQYIYTKLSEVKREMLAEAAKDARTRAEKIVESVGGRIGGVREARMGVMQITPADSFEASDSGVNDTTSLEKDITSVVSVTFGVK